MPLFLDVVIEVVFWSATVFKTGWRRDGHALCTKYAQTCPLL